jgi:hypothetical protein
MYHLGVDPFDTIAIKDRCSYALAHLSIQDCWDPRATGHCASSGFSRNTLSVHSVRVFAASPIAPTSTASDTVPMVETERVPVPYRVTVHIPALRQHFTRVLARLVLPLQ